MKPSLVVVLCLGQTVWALVNGTGRSFELTLTSHSRSSIQKAQEIQYTTHHPYFYDPNLDNQPPRKGRRLNAHSFSTNPLDSDLAYMISRFKGIHFSTHITPPPQP